MKEALFMKPEKMRALGFVFLGLGILFAVIATISYISFISDMSRTYSSIYSYSYSYSNYKSSAESLGGYVIFALLSTGGFGAAIPLLIVSGIKIKRNNQANNTPTFNPNPTQQNFANPGFQNPTLTTGNTFCTKCGNPVQAGVPFCNKCGNRLS